MKKLRDERGGVLALTALSLAFVLLPIMALAIDAGNLYYTQRQLQTLADSAAMAGALEIDACGSGNPQCGAMVTAMNKAFAEDNPPAGATLAAHNNPPSALSNTTNDPNYGNSTYVEAIVTMSVPTYFAKAFWVNTVTLTARAEAGYAVPPAGGDGGANANHLTLNAGANITNANGACGINDNDSSGLSTNAGVTVNLGTGSFTYHGSTYNKNCGSCTTYNPLPTTNSPTEADPFASLSAPSQPSTTTTNVSTISGNTTLAPGYYPNTINFNSGTYTVTLSPGLYYFGGGFNINSNVTIDGTSGVTLYFPSGANSNINSAATWKITAPSTAQIAGDTTHTEYNSCASCANMAIWSAGSLNLDSSSSSDINGAIYLPTGTLTLNGGSSAASYGQIFANNLMVNSAISLDCSGGGNPNGSKHLSLAE